MPKADVITVDNSDCLHCFLTEAIKHWTDAHGTDDALQIVSRLATCAADIIAAETNPEARALAEEIVLRLIPQAIAKRVEARARMH